MGFSWSQTTLLVLSALICLRWLHNAPHDTEDAPATQNQQFSSLGSWLRNPRPQLIAHRGTRYGFAENTIQAFISAHLFGADVLEFDVRLTADNQLVIYHDGILNRTTNDEEGKAVRHLTLEQIQALDAGHHFSVLDSSVQPPKKIYPLRGRGHLIPTLEEFLETFMSLDSTFAKDKVNVNIEIKDDEIEAADKLYEILTNFDSAQKKKLEKEKKEKSEYYVPMEDRVIISSIHCDIINHLRSKSKFSTGACEMEASIFAVSSLLNAYPFYHNYIQPLKMQVLQIPTHFGPVQLSEPRNLAYAHATGHKIHYWVVNDPQEMKRLLKMGADGIITDRVDLGIQVFDEMGIKSNPRKGFNVSSVRSTDANDDELETVMIYYDGAENIPDEVHTCHSAKCVIFGLLATYLQLILLAIGGLCVTASVYCCGGRRKNKLD